MKNKLIVKIINLILNIYGKIYKFNCKFIYDENEFEYVNITLFNILIDCHIKWSFLYSDMHNKLFEKYLTLLGLTVELPTFLLSVLHEVGHHKIGNINKYSEMVDITKYKKLLNITKKEELDLLIYYNIPEEYEASKWAVSFINSHKHSLIVLSYILYPFINYVYNKYWDLLIKESSIYVEIS